MAQNVIDWAWKHSRAVNGSLIVLLAIAHEADRDGITTMSLQELTRKTRLSERAVRTAVADLATLRELNVTTGSGRGHRSEYRVAPADPSNPAESATFSTVKGAESATFEPGNPAESATFTGTPPDGNPAESATFAGHNGRSGHPPPVKGAESATFGISDMFITSTGIDEVQVKDVPAITSRPDVERLCRHLADRIEANGCKRPAIGRKWRDAARLMLDRDGRTEQQITAAIDWCQDSEFWRANILSMPKLREKYDQLRMQAVRKPAKNRQAETDELFGAAMKRAIAKEGRA